MAPQCQLVGLMIVVRSWLSRGEEGGRGATTNRANSTNPDGEGESLSVIASLKIEPYSFGQRQADPLKRTTTTDRNEAQRLPPRSLSVSSA